jgi:hypothetical protein
MGSPLSGLVAEIFLQYYEQSIVKNCLENNKIMFYNRCVDDILIIYDNNRINTEEINKYMNNIHNHMEFKMTDEENCTVSFLDLQIKRTQNQLLINIYQKPTTTATTVYYNSNHPMEHKLAAYRFLLNRLHQLLLTQENKKQEMNIIYQIAKMNEYPLAVINQLNEKIMNKKQNITDDTIQTKRYDKWITFEYHSPLIRKVTNIFRNTNLRITFRVNNTINNHLRNKQRSTDRYENSGIYSIKCNTCGKRYVGQTGRNVKARFSEHQRYTI